MQTPRRFRRLLYVALLLATGCTSLEGAIYQEQALEREDCARFADEKYRQYLAYLSTRCFLKGQLARMTAIEDGSGQPNLREAIYQACLKETDTTLEVILYDRFNATIEGDLPAVTANSEACRRAQGTVGAATAKAAEKP